MKKYLLLILLTISFVSAFGQPQPGSYNLTLNFGPSFLSASQLVIQGTQDSVSLDLRVYKNFINKEYRINSTVVAPAANATELLDFLKTYKFRIRNNRDTVNFYKVLKNGDSVLSQELSIGTDGINVHGDFNQNNVSHNFGFWSPDKGTENARFMELIFGLTKNAFTNKGAIDYLEQLEQYFPHHLGLKKLSDSPLSYKLYGSITSDDQDELGVFLKSLPSDTKVVIDMSNFSGMGTMFYSWFKDYCGNKENIYWLNPTDRVLIHLYKIGINNRYVISKKKIRKITTLDGREKVLYNTD